MSSTLGCFFLAPQLIANCGTRRVHKGRGTFHVNCPPPCTALLALCTRQAQPLPQPGGLLRAKVSFRVSLKVSVFGFRFSVFVFFGVAFALVLR